MTSSHSRITFRSAALLALVVLDCRLDVAASSGAIKARQLPTSATAAAATSAPTPMASVLPDGDIQTGTFPPIDKSMAPSTMTALPALYTPGTPATIKGAPNLPTSSLIVANYPALDKIPPVDSPQVKEWLSKIDMTKIPTNSPTGLNGCSNATNAQAVAQAGAQGNCWWTCGGCTRNTDITSCPTQGVWGASFDDGPSPETPKLLQYLDQQKIKTTFFVVGSRVLSRPQMLQYEYQTGHQISVHTWSHPYLTTLTNEQIVAELGWSKKVIHDTLGVTPNTMRPPYGDIDDRVRYIALAMGLTPIIWTTSPSGQTYDTQDWKIGAGTVTPAQVLHNFQTILGGASSLSTGFIVLAHDLYTQSVALAVEFVLPGAIASGNLTIQPIITCLGQPLSEGYMETSTSVKSNVSVVVDSTGTKAFNATAISKTSINAGLSFKNLQAFSLPTAFFVGGLQFLVSFIG